MKIEYKLLAEAVLETWVFILAVAVGVIPIVGIGALIAWLLN